MVVNVIIFNLYTWEDYWILYLSVELKTDLLCLYPIEDKYYARFDTHSYHRYREMYFNARLDVKSWQRHWSAKSMSRASCHSACLKSMSRTITMQGLKLAAITAAEKCTLMLESTQNHDKVTEARNLGQGHRVIVRAWRVCQGQLLCKVWHSQLSPLQRNAL